MHMRHVFTALLYASHCVEGVVARESALRRRQENSDAEPSPTSTLASSASATSSARSTMSTSDAVSTSAEPAEQTSTSEEPPPTTSSSALPTTPTEAPTTADDAAQASPTADEREMLPIQPTITPAIGIAGVVLMLTGLAFCLIGIKHQWLHVFLSAAYSTSLGVTVLIIYVMSPPVSDAIQGAYFVAALLTGLIFGALSLVFKEITEGLGCLIGGFCLAMWFMVLKPGGLVQSDPGRAILISVFSAVGLSLSFSQWTRNYGLILCTAFAGAMITVLGIDCFSRAGLKEFWIYVWNLNKNIFPIGTDTYPVTRGIRVEIAVTIVIFLFGVMSQLKIWKIVKERRDKKEAARLAQDESRDQLAGEVGQDVEALNERSRAQWEAIYGNGSKAQGQQDSGVGTSVGSTHKKSASVTTREVDGIEMDDYHRQSDNKQMAKHSSKARKVLVPALSNDQDDSRSQLAGSADWSSHRGSRRSTSSNGVESQYEVPLTQQPGGPSVVPLPFSPPQEGDGRNGQGDVSPVSDRSDKAHQGMTLNPRALRRLDEQAPVRLRRIEDDRASSIAATADDEPDVDGESIGRRSFTRPVYRVESKDGLFPEDEQIREDRDRSRTPSGQRTPQLEEHVEEDDDEVLVRPQTAKPDAIAPAPTDGEQETQRKRQSMVSSHRRSFGSRVSGDRNVSDEHKPPLVKDLGEHLPESISKVAMAYRTNEWAKHIADADQPDDTEAEPDSPGIQVDHAFREEAARPVDTEALSEVPVLTAVEGPRKPSKKASKNPYKRMSDGPPPVTRKVSGTPVYAFQRSDSQQSQQSLMHQSSSGTLRRDARNTSTPVDGPLVESPIEEAGLAVPSTSRNLLTPMGSSNNLLDQRNDRLQRRTTTTSFAALGSGSRLNVATPEIPASGRATPIGATQPPPGEDMTLAERKAYMQQQQTSAAPQSSNRARRSSGPAPQASRMHSASNPNLIYDSHQPKRSNTVDTSKQQTMFTQWRSSLQQDSNAKLPLVDQDQARQFMMSQQQQAAMDRQRRQSQRMQRESMMDVAMRTGQLHSAHTDVLRKMQAKANENAK